MPINESSAIRRTSLTKEQQREAEAACYGLSAPKSMDQQFSPEQIEQMRAILAQHDAQTKGGLSRIKEFDLNNPPKEPYVYREFPRMVYDHDARAHKVVPSKKELQAALDAGWQLEPYPAEAPAAAGDAHLSVSEQAEIDRLDREARKPRKQAAAKE